MKQNYFFLLRFFLFFVDKFSSYVIFFLIIKLKKKKKKVFEFHINSFLFISSSSQPKILSIYTHGFLVLYSLYYVPYNYLLYSSLLFCTLPTTLQVFLFSFIKLNRFCVFVAFLLYIIWFLSISFINRLKFYVWSHPLVFFLEVNIASNILVFFYFLITWFFVIDINILLYVDLFCYGFCLVLCSM